ncbi:hypothetical protein SAMN05444000_11199 [Shimia gijangensis]|uniref:Uncharacterized protein n=2 Tax=Shimia gijangensis TaxID=1470563 RepID=A0A1M6L753_9RHOB|nr:hypothetical protein SAMN05444000_11199 [Shimia gijangensis]
MSSDEHTYEAGLQGLRERYNSRREPFVFYKEGLPSVDVDLDVLARKTVPETATSWQKGEPVKGSSWATKRRAIAAEFVGNSQLAYLNAMLISNLRKTGAPAQAAPLFLRLWEEQHVHLIAKLDLRWQVSSIMTFADHGKNDVQRQVGQALRMLFGVMKMYEFERRFSGLSPEVPFDLQGRSRASLPMQMEPFALQTGGLDINILAPVWDLALTDPGIAPLANNLMEELNRDPRTVFRRIKTMRQQYIKQKRGT